ncbi:unnamed protein product [Adineta steineri]|uniref:Transposase domain-containing protein n=1 Tax=Adineta steineri TaxID=433720 RepID=A0A816BWK7_9BILA|nr:unnamed protein product [Adineta steineri]CAF1612893.1 unnamed protein product [Adineta steineri]
MSNKQFYRKTATERQRERRQRAAAIEFDSKLNDLEADYFHSNAVQETSDIQMIVEDFCTSTNNEDYQFDDDNYSNTQNIILESSSESEGEINDDNDNYNDDDDDDNYNDGDDDDDIIRELINLSNINREQKLYSSCNLSIYNACMEIIKLSRDLNLNKQQIQRLLNGLRLLLPTENKLPRTVPSLLKIVDIDCSNNVTYYCRGCFHHLASPQQTSCSNGCSMHNQSRPFRNVSELVICDIKKEILSTAKRYIHLIQEYQNESKLILPGDVVHGKIYTKLPSNKSSKLTLVLHTDGAPVTKVGGKSLWPVQCTFIEISPPVRDYADSTMIFGSWLGGTHPNRDLLWSRIVEQIHDLLQTGITIHADTGEKFKCVIRVQLATFDLPALAQNCNIIQFNGYNACPDCDIRGIAIDRQVFYPYSKTPAAPKTDYHYTSLSMLKTNAAASIGIKGPTPLTQILIFPDQIAKDYMHLVCSGHFKTLITYWERILLPGVFDQSSNYIISVVLPHSFKYQFIPLVQYSQWKTKMFRDFLLYVSPIFVALFLPDKLASHFLHYFIYVRALYFYEDTSQLDEIENMFNYYYEHMKDYYGEKSQLCTLHLHLHLKDQVVKHGALVYTSCFARESYIGHALKWCLGKKYILKQFITWYSVDRALASDNSLKLNDIFYVEKFDENFMDKCFIQNYQQKLITCSSTKNIDLSRSRFYSRYSRGLKVFHSRAYTRSGNAISYLVSILTKTCPMNRHTCLGEVLFYFHSSGHYYAFIKKYACMNFSISDALSTISLPPIITDRLKYYYGFYNHKRFSYKIIPVSYISNKIINMKWINDILAYTDVVCEWEHD